MVILRRAIPILLAVPLGVTTAAAQPVKQTAYTSQQSGTGISVFTYTVGGPAHVKGPQLVSDAVVRVRRYDSGAVIRQVKRTSKGHVVLSLKPGKYRVEAALEPPEVVPGRRCGSPTTVYVRKGERARVKLYCSIP